MSDLAQTVDRIFTAHATDKVRLAGEDDGAWPDALWGACIDAGLHLALVDTGDAALGLTPQEAFDIVRRAGAHAVPIPLPESMLANWLLARAGLPPQSDPLGFLDETRVPWGRRIAAMVSVSREADAVRLFHNVSLAREGRNIAGEPRDDMRLAWAEDDRAVNSKLFQIGALKVPIGADALPAALAAVRTAQIAGAIEAATRLTVPYAQVRIQFGKPIGKFQAVQHAIAQLAEQSAMAGAAADMAADAFARGLDVPAIAAAKCVASEAAGIAAGLAHQMHGAIGFSRAHALHHLTRRLWSWRDEGGNEAHWAGWLGRHLAAKGAEQLWPEITTL